MGFIFTAPGTDRKLPDSAAEVASKPQWKKTGSVDRKFARGF
jgi:hypothetical protein